MSTLPGIAYGASPFVARIPEYARTPLLHYPGQRDLGERGFVYAK